MVVKSFNESSGRLECLFISDIEQNGFSQKTELIGYAYVDEHHNDDNDDKESAHGSHKPGEQLEALVVGFDPLARAFCLVVDKEKSRAYKKNFEASFRVKTACRVDQELKAEVLYIADWFVLLGLKQHAKGRLALMPLFKNDFTRLNTFRAVQDDMEHTTTAAVQAHVSLDRRVKQKQVVSVSTARMSESSKKSEKRFAYFGVGETVRVRVRDNTADDAADDADLAYLIVVHDEAAEKENKKVVMRHLAALNENRATAEKRKLEETAAAAAANGDAGGDRDDDVVKKKVLVSGERVGRGAAKRKAGERALNDEDSLEVVARVMKKPKLTVPDDHQVLNGNRNGHVDEFAFPWEVNDFDQFNAIVSRASNSSIQNGTADETASKKQKNIKKDKVVDDRLIYEVRPDF